MAWRRLGRMVPRDADQQEEAAETVPEPGYGDLVTYGEKATTHIAFWVGEGRILHAAGGRAVVEEEEPAELRALRRRFVRLSARRDSLNRAKGGGG
jgi:cell wall-associated NlpC family hydrolase